MSWINIVSESDATGELKIVYDEIIESRGKMSNIMRIHSLNPASMRAHMDLYMSTVFGKMKLRRSERELIATTVSAANKCPYCIAHHAEALMHYWKDRARIDAVIDDPQTADLSERELAMVDYAVKLTTRVADVDQKDIEELRAAGFSDKDILDINLIASYFNFVNRIALGLGVEFTEEEKAGFQY
jgi:uncharacterized peroxidase-related enzyme